jgi:hypothetical protein
MVDAWGLTSSGAAITAEVKVTPTPATLTSDSSTQASTVRDRI